MKRLIAISISFLMLTPLLGMGGGQAIVIKHKAAASGFSVVKVNTTCGATGNFASPVTCTITNPTASGHSLLAFLAISNGSAL